MEKDAKRRRALIAKQKQKSAKQLQDLEDPDALEKIEQMEKEKLKVRQEQTLKRQEEKRLREKEMRKKAKKEKDKKANKAAKKSKASQG